jgi:hypothetical protein
MLVQGWFGRYGEPVGRSLRNGEGSQRVESRRQTVDDALNLRDGFRDDLVHA